MSTETETMTEEQRHAYNSAVASLYALWAMLEPQSPAQDRVLGALDELREVPKSLCQ